MRRVIMDELELWDPDEALHWERWYGPWRSLRPSDASVLLDGMDASWWIVGGHAVEAFTGVSRPHEDLDVGLFGRDVSPLRRHLGARYHLWSVDDGMLRPLDGRFPEPLSPLGQVWIREHAEAPWLVDTVLTPDVGGRWRSKRDDEHVAELDEVTWVDDDGIRYLNPEIVLLFKAKSDRRKDRRDLEVAWPLLGDDRRAWLQASVARLYPRHPWNAVLTADDGIHWPSPG